MKNFDINEIPLSTIKIVGVLASVVSFVYYFVLNNPYEFVFWLICIIDFFLFTLNAYRIIEVFDLTKIKTVVFTVAIIIGFFAFCEIIVFLFTSGTRFEYNLELFFDVLRFSLFLSPSLILLLPVIIFIAKISDIFYSLMSVFI